MWTDAVDLRDFYASSLGRVARRMIGRRIRLLWPDVRGLNILGVGYAAPFLGVFRAEAQRLVALMPAAQGVLRWPADAPNLTALAEETSLPFADRAIDRVLLVHALECAEHTRPMMREIWRVLDDGGRLIVVAPNRRGLWARFERTPFGHGRPYSPAQLSRGLRDTLFTPYQSATALYVPPIHSRMLLSSAGAWEEIGQRWFPSFAGVVLFEAIAEWFRPHAYALILLREGGYPCVFSADYYGGGGRPSMRAILDSLLAARRDVAYGAQTDYFDDANIVGWTRAGDAEHPRALAVVMSDAAGGTKRMATGRPDATFVDATGSVSGGVTAGSDGWADFRCNERAVSVWVQQ